MAVACKIGVKSREAVSKKKKLAAVSDVQVGGKDAGWDRPGEARDAGRSDGRQRSRLMENGQLIRTRMVG